MTYYQFKNFYTGKCLDTGGQANGSIVQINDCTGGYNEQWTVQTSTHSGWPRLVARHSGKCLQPLNESSVDRTQEVQYGCYTAWSQEWNQS